MIMRAAYKKGLASIVFLVLAVMLFRYSGLQECLTLETVKQNIHIFEAMVVRHYWISVLIFIAVYIFVVTTTIPASALLTMVGGFLFGVVPGVIYSNIGATIGAMFSFLIARYVIGAWLQRRYTRKLAKFNTILQKQGAQYILTLHLMAFVPFFVINILAGLTSVSLWTFVWTTAVGILPGSLVFAFAGRQLHAIEKVQDVLSWNVLLAFAFLGCLAFIPGIIRWLRKSPELEIDEE